VHDPPSFKEEIAKLRANGKLRIDGLGIGLIAVGFACLEVVLDRGQIDDWFGSPTIVALLIAAVITLSIAIYWEWNHTDPVVEITLLKERNFASATIFYFLFGFVLFGSTTMIPEILQTLYGYTATDAGLVLGPGALVITVLAPFVARLVQSGKVNSRHLIIFSYVVVACSMWYYGSFTPQTDYFHYAFARAVQGFGYAFLFVPVSVMAYSYLPPQKNNKASSFTNLARNWGGSFGVAFVTTFHERRTDLHQARLGDTLAHGLPLVDSTRDSLTHTFQQLGFSSADAANHASGRIYDMLQQQASLLGFRDCFYLLGVISLIGIPVVFFTRNFRPGGRGASTGH
jgi:DHA2 family multidrug resistance protein